MRQHAASCFSARLLTASLLTIQMITPEVIAEHNLTPDEFNRIKELLGREPNLVELGVFSVMWSEHCSYKSSRVHLKRLPTSGERVIVPPGENAGIVDVGDGWCAAFKIESHNHPSFIEPFQGAATGVGGILRDIFTMGARPIAALNSLRFGSLDDPKNGRRNRSLLAGVVAGIAHYGNAFGVPTVGGEVAFDDAYALESSGECVRAGTRAQRSNLLWQSHRRGQSGLVCRRKDRSRWNSRRDDGFSGIRRRSFRKTADGASR